MSSDELPLEELARLPDFYHPGVAPDRRAVAYYYDGTGRNELYVDELDGSGPRQLSDGNVPRSARWWPRWRGDGEAILFHRDDDGDEQNDIYEIDLDGEVRNLVSPDGQAILMGTDESADYLLYASDEGEQMNLYRYSYDSDDIMQLTSYAQPVRGGQFSPDGSRLAYVTNESDDLSNRDVYVADADGSNPRKLDIGNEGAQAQLADWHPDGGALLVSDDTPDKSRAGVYDLATDELTWYGTDAYVERPSAFLPDGDGFVGIRMRNAAFEPVIFSEDGTVDLLDLPDGVSMFPSGGHRHAFLPDGQLLVSTTTPTDRKQLFTYELDTDTATCIKDADYGDIDPDRFVDAEYITYESADGLEIGALLYDSGERPSPAIVAVHGGPHAQSTKRFDQYAQFFVDRGYTVLQPNYRGSIGRGREFKEMIHHDWGGGEADDIAAAGHWLAAQDWIDEDRLIVYGGSYGGYSTYWQLVSNPDQWFSGIAWVGITDLLQLYENSMPHFQATLEEQLGDPDENEAFYRERSPITHVDNIESPLLMVHGVNDPRCPIEQARVFKDALIEEVGWEPGEDFVYEELTEEGHGTTDLDQKVRAFRIIEEYLEDWLKANAPTHP